MATKQDKCENCGKTAPDGKTFNECAGCHEARYCSRECQKKGWGLHKEQCKTLSNYARTYIDGIINNTMLFFFLMALLGSFEVFGTKKGYLKCVVIRKDIDSSIGGDDRSNTIRYSGFITKVKDQHRFMQSGNNLILLEYTYNNRVYEKPMHCSQQLCAENLDETKKLGYNLFKIPENVPVEFDATNKFYFHLKVAKDSGVKLNGTAIKFDMI